MSVFWSNFGGGVIQSTPGDAKANPTSITPGSGVPPNYTNDQAAVDSRALFPDYETPPSVALPANFPTNVGTPVKISDFMEWHSQIQAYYFDKFGLTTQTFYGETSTGAIDLAKQFNAVRSVTEVRVYILQDLQKRDFVDMSTADQTRIAGLSYFGTIFNSYGLTNNGIAANQLINDALLTINTRNSVNTEASQYFRDQINNIQTRINTSRIYSLADIKEKLDEIVKRHERYDKFQTGVWDGDTTVRPITIDGNQAIRNGMNVFIAQEKQIRDLDNIRLQLAQSGELNGRRMDAPNLVFLFQQYTNLVMEAVNTAATEEINQINALLKQYAEVQRLVNETLKTFVATEKQNEEKKGWLGRTGNVGADIEIAALAYEDKIAFGRKHPLEILYGITRPLHDIFLNPDANYAVRGTYNQFFKDQWNSFATSLADTVTLINQESQIKMNEVNSAEKQKNRHFELANNALSKAADILQNIARST